MTNMDALTTLLAVIGFMTILYLISHFAGTIP
jgi:hypothetical protein